MSARPPARLPIEETGRPPARPVEPDGRDGMAMVRAAAADDGPLDHGDHIETGATGLIPERPDRTGSDVYGYCPICGAPGVSRERRPNGNDRCEAGHEYPSKDTVARAEFSEVVVKDPADERIDQPFEPPKEGWAKAIYDAKFVWRRRNVEEMVLVLDEATYVALGREIALRTSQALYDAWMAKRSKRGLIEGAAFYGMPVWILSCMRGFIVLNDPPWNIANPDQREEE